MKLTRLVGQAKTDTGQVTVDTGRCEGDPVRGYIRIFARNPLFPESGQYIFLTIEQVRALDVILDGWLETEEGLPQSVQS